jgi:hypothetical protein
MQRQQPRQPHQSQRLFTASEVAEYEYCALAWWHEQYEPLAQEDSEILFANMVELEEKHGPQATALPEYQVMEQLLLRRGAFEVGQQQHQEHADEVAELEEERIEVASASDRMRSIVLVAAIILVLALVLIVASFVFIGH